MLGQEGEPAENSPSFSSSLSAPIEIDDLEPLSPIEITINKQHGNLADGDSAAALVMPEALAPTHDIDIDFRAEPHAQGMLATDELSSHFVADEQPPGAASQPASNEDQERRDSGAAAGPSDGSAAMPISPALTSESGPDDHVPLGELQRKESLEVTHVPLEGLQRKESVEVDREGELVQKPNGLAPIRVSSDGQPVEAARPPAESPTPGPPTPGTGAAAAGQPPHAEPAPADRPLAAATAVSASTADDSSDEEEEDSRARRPGEAAGKTGHRKKRRHLLPPIRGKDKCGWCHHCINPQMKKACITARKRMLAELDKKGDLPLALMRDMDKKGSGNLPGTPQSRSKAPQDFSALERDEKKDKRPVDPFYAIVEEITHESGGVVERKYLEKLQRLLDLARNNEMCFVALMILDNSTAEVKRAFVHGRGLKKLLSWLEAAEEGNSKSMTLGNRVLASFVALPIGVAALQESGAGKLMRKMSKSGPEQLRQEAKRLLAQWMEAVEAERASGPPKRPAPGEPSSSAPAKKPATVSSQVANGKPAQQRQAPAKTGAASGARSGAPSGQPKQEQKPLAVLAPADLDDVLSAGAVAKPPAKPLAKPKVSVKDSLYNPKKVHQLQVLDDEAAQKLASQRAEAAAAQKATPSADAASSAAAGGASSGAGSSAYVPVPAAKSSATTRITAFTPSIVPAPMPTSGLGGPRPPPPLLPASARAALAAARVPSPDRAPGQERVPKSKKVSWAAEPLLVSVRWFHRNDRPDGKKEEEGVQEDAAQAVPGIADAAAAHPPGFESAARAEHASEAEAIRHLLSQPALVEEEDAEVPEMEPTLHWIEPPFAFLNLPPDQLPACGEDSEEKKHQAVRHALRHPVHYGPGGLHPPDSPDEPANEAPANVQEKRVLLQVVGAPPQQAQPAAAAASPPMQQQPPQFQQPQALTQPPPQQRHFSQHMPLQHLPPPPQQVHPQQPAYAPPEMQQQQPQFAQLPPPPPQQPQHQYQYVQHQQAQPQLQAPMLDAVEQQLQNLKPLLQQLQQQQQQVPPQQQLPPQQLPAPPFPPQQQQEPGILGRPPLATAVPVAGGPRPIQLPLPGPPPIATDTLEEGETRPAGRGAQRGGPRPRGRGAGRGRGADKPRPERPRAVLPCAFYNLHMGCRLGDRCKFEHKFSDETEDEVERRAQSVSNQPLQFMRSLAPGEQLRIRGPSFYYPNVPVEGNRKHGANIPIIIGGTGEVTGRKRERERDQTWERKTQPRRERDAQFDT